MKQSLFTVFTVILTLLMSMVGMNSFAQFSGAGSGTKSNPYQITINAYSTQTRDSEGFKYINDFTYIKDLSDYTGSKGNCSFINCSQHDNGNIIKANVFCVENFYGVSEGQSYANLEVFADKGLTTKIGQFNFCWAYYCVSFDISSSSRVDFFFVDAYDTMEIGESKQLTYSDGTVYTFTLLDKIVSNINSEKKLVFSVDRPLYFGGNTNGSAGIERFSNRVQIKYIDDSQRVDFAYVDLGLPSGIKWANMNVGANAIEDAGSKFAWGETSSKDDFTVDNYKFGSSASSLTKYNETDGLTVLQVEDDAATVNMGAGWRIPTLEEWNELNDNCTRQWTTVNDIYGYRFTGSNGNSIFLPVWIATSWMGGAGAYWTSTLSNDICAAFDIDFDGGGFYIDDAHAGGEISRAWARNVRAVYDNNNTGQENPEPQTVVEVTDVSNMANAIYIEPLKGSAGTDVNIEVKLKNANTATSYGFELVLPAGVTISTSTDGDFDGAVTKSTRHNGHTLTTNKVANNTYKVGVASLSSKALTDNDGLVLTIKAHLADNMAVGDYPISIQNPLIVNTDGTKPDVQNTQSKITIEDYMKGDVDGDGVVDLADAVLVINHYVGKPVAKFNEKAADVDGDGVIDLADAVRIINFYVGKVQSLAPSLDLDGLDPQ